MALSGRLGSGLSIMEAAERMEKDEERPRGQGAKMATSTMNGMYVSKETPAMIRQRNRHVRASAGNGKEALSIDDIAGNAWTRAADHVRLVGRQV